MIRPAEVRDISRIAEILIFTKRVTYRPIYHNDPVSFGEMQVLPLAEEYMKQPKRLADTWVYDDGFVKGLITLQMTKGQHGIKTLQIEELYVDVFFHQEGIGSQLLAFAQNMAKEQGSQEMFLWVLEKNEHARIFYEKKGFRADGEKKFETGTPEYLLRYKKIIC